MRFKLTLKVDKNAFGCRLPLNYQYELSAFIYRTLARADKKYSTWLHDNGFNLKGKAFKLFTFSNFIIPAYRVEKTERRLRIDSERVEWFISFLPDKSTDYFICGLFADQVFQIGDKYSVVQFEIEKIEAVPSPEFTSEMKFRTLSPICISYRGKDDRYPQFISPEHPSAPDIVLNNLLNKYEVYYGKPYKGNTDFSFQPVTPSKPKLLKIKTGTAEETNIKGYLFDFIIRAPVELMRIAYESSVGEKGSMGFGMVKVI
jgi:CRISPR-associated endoribonuclease Cas6